VAQNRKARIGIVGAGWWAAENHIPVLNGFPDAEIAGICGLNVEDLHRIQQTFGIGYATADANALLALPGLDGVVVSSPHHLHFQHATAALERGLHVVCEKPISLKAAEARSLAVLANSRGLHFLIPYGWNYTPVADVSRRAVRAGDIGEILHVHCHMASALRDLFSAEGAWFAKEALVKPDLRTWSDPGIGGGYGHGQLTHALGLLFWVADLRPASVFAYATPSRTGADLSMAVTCRFQNGAVGTLGGAGLMPPGSFFQVDIRLFGSEGMILIDIERPRVEVRRYDGRDSAFQPDMPPGDYPCVPPLRTFVDLVLGKPTENRSPVETGVRSVEVLEAAIRSLTTGAPEEICEEDRVAAP
jgi:predicted dehydrogenase